LYIGSGRGRNMERARAMELATIFGATAVLAYLAVLAAANIYAIDNYGTLARNTTHSDYIDIKVAARQFSWEFVLPNGTVSYNTLTIKAGQLYRLSLTSADVFHSFYIPELGIKYAAVPGFTYIIWLKVDRPGVYHIYCAEYCGVGHYLMIGKLVVVP